MTSEHRLDGKKVAVLATHGFEAERAGRAEAAGAAVHVISPEEGSIRGWQVKDWGDEVPVDMALSAADAGDYDAPVLPGGQINPDVLRTIPEAVAFVQAFFAAGKPVGAICHAPWLLVEAGVARGRKLTAYKSIRTDLRNAGGEVVDAPVVVDRGLVTSRQPDDLPAFNAKLVEEIAEGRHAGQRRSVA